MLNKNNITDVTVVFGQVTQNSQTIYYGNRKGKDWFALFDDAGNLQKEWYGKNRDYKRKKDTSENKTAGSSTSNDYFVGYFVAKNAFQEFDGTYILVFGGQAFHLDNNQQVEYGFKVNQHTPTIIFSKNRFFNYESGNASICDFEGNVIAKIEDAYDSPYSLLTGFQDGKVWVAYEDEEKGWQEFVSAETFERNRSIHLGYGEYANIYIEKIEPTFFLKTNWGFAFIPTLSREPYYCESVFLGKDDNLLIVLCNVKSHYLIDWYDDTVFVGGTTVISSLGEILAEFAETEFTSSSDFEDVEPVSITDGIRFEEDGFVRRNYEKGIDVWRVTIPQLDDIQENAKVTMTLLEKGASIWRYSCQVLNYDGSQNTFELNLNVETGELF